MSFKALLQIKEFQQIAPYATLSLVAFLGITSQWLFVYLDPAPLAHGQTFKFNLLIASLLTCYYRSCTLDPGRINREWDGSDPTPTAKADNTSAGQREVELRKRWCRRCELVKPPRAHHCKSCQRCIPKMDHHCPWTANCVSHRIMPHFIRFLFFTTSALLYLQYFIWIRIYALWQKRLLPSYLGPTVTQMVLLFLLTVVNTMTLIGLSLLFIRTAWCVLANTTTIEGWEIDRHEALVRRARYTGGTLRGPDGNTMRITRQEFPYDVGVWSNLAQAMGTSNPVMWFFPLAPALPVDAGTSFPVNGFEEEGKAWPPPDPDRVFRVMRRLDPSEAFTESMDPDDFRRRQAEDFERRRRVAGSLDDQDVVRRRKPFHVRLEGERKKKKKQQKEKQRDGERVYEINSSDEEDEDEYGGDETPYDDDDDDDDDEQSRGRPANIVDDDDGEEAWRNAEGERLADFGVDEDVEFYDEEDDDDMPLAELLRLKRERAAATETLAEGTEQGGT